MTGAIAAGNDSSRFTIALDPNQTITAVVVPSDTLQATLAVADPDGNTLGSATAAAAGKQVFVQTVVAVAAGTYTFTVGSAAGSADRSPCK